MAGVIFTEKAGDRIADTVRWVEGERGRRPGGPTGGGLEPTFVRVTSSTADGNGNYPGVITVRDHAGSWQDYSAVKLKPLNAESLTSGTRYGCRGVGFAPGGEELYTPLAGGGGTLPPDAAPNVARGLVTNDTQSLGGRKTFVSRVTVSQELPIPEIEMHLGVSCPLSTSFGWGLSLHGTASPGSAGIYTHPTGGGMLLHSRRSDVPGINGMLSVGHSGGGAWVANDGGGIAGVNFDFELWGKHKVRDYTTLNESGEPASGVGWTGTLLGGIPVVSGIVCGGSPSTYTIDGGTW